MSKEADDTSQGFSFPELQGLNCPLEQAGKGPRGLCHTRGHKHAVVCQAVEGGEVLLSGG